MMRALITSGSGMIAQQTNLDVIANNLANVNTTAFKEQRAEFQDMMYQTQRASGAPTSTESTAPEPSQVGLGTRFVATATSFQQGAFINTGSPTNVAVSGEGFFKIMKDGQPMYTRDGSFKIDAAGQLVTSDGYPLEPAITIPPNTTQISISPDGKVSGVSPGSSNSVEMGNIELSMFANPAGLTRMGQNLYTATTASGEATSGAPGANGAGQLSQYNLEASNVQIVEEMVRMITAQRAYEINSKAIQTADDMLGILNSLKR